MAEISLFSILQNSNIVLKKVLKVKIKGIEAKKDVSIIYNKLVDEEDLILMKRYHGRYLTLWNFIIVVGIILSFNVIMNIGYEAFFFDCGQYRLYGRELFSDDNFNLMNLSDGFRGYIFPTFLGFSEHLDMKMGIGAEANPVCIKIFTSIIYSFFFACSLPKLMSLLFQNRNCVKSYNVIINLLLVMIFFWGLFIYPLTDLLAMILCVNAVICMLTATKNQTMWKKILFFFLAGVIVYAAYNVRSIYLFSGMVAIFTVFIANMRNYKRRRGFIYFLSFLLGIFICSIPQIIINYNLGGNISILLPTDSLMLQQLKWGMYYQRYETYVGNAYITSGLIFEDTVGLEILRIVGDITSIKEYILLFLRYPLDFMGLYARHVLNMFLPIYPEQYIFNLEKNRSGLLLLNYSVLFIFVTWCVTTIQKNKMKLASGNLFTVCVIAILLLPSVAIMPGALEQRFSIMIYVLIFGCLCYVVNYKALLSMVKEKWIKFLFLYVIGLFAVLSVWGNTLSSLQFADIIIGY